MLMPSLCVPSPFDPKAARTRPLTGHEKAPSPLREGAGVAAPGAGLSGADAPGGMASVAEDGGDAGVRGADTTGGSGAGTGVWGGATGWLGGGSAATEEGGGAARGWLAAGMINVRPAWMR